MSTQLITRRLVQLPSTVRSTNCALFGTLRQQQYTGYCGCISRGSSLLHEWEASAGTSRQSSSSSPSYFSWVC
jgi:hypothetical protein